MKKASRSQKPNTIAPTAKSGAKLCILVQHNEEPIRELAKVILTLDGYECKLAASTSEAFKMIASGKRCDLLLCKVMESLEENWLKRLIEQFPDLPVFVWGARPIAVFREALRQGADDYLAFPFARDDSGKILRRTLTRRQKRKNRLSAP
jgi:DNA-binding NtrC family response regulator